MKGLNFDCIKRNNRTILKVTCLLYCLWISGCARDAILVEQDYYDPDHEILKRTDMSSYTLEQFSEVVPLCVYDEHCRAITYGHPGCSGLGGFVIYSTVMGEENVTSLHKVANESRHSEGVLSDSGESVCAPAGPRQPLLYCDDVCINVFQQLSELDTELYKAKAELRQCEDQKPEVQ